jgi:hypothetical protein
MNLETMSWFAAVLAIPVMFLTWLFKPKEFIAFCKNCWGLFFATFVVIALIAAWIRGWFNWLIHPATLPVWVLILLVCLGMLIAFAVWLVVKSLNKQPLPEIRPNWPPVQEPARPAQPAQPDWHNYISDELFGVLWRWSYIGNTINDSALVAFCPKQGCMNRLESGFSPENPHMHLSLYGIADTMACHRCGFKKHFDCDHETLKRRVMDEIERLVNTRQYVERLKTNS